jgi:mannonate dehydratase
MPDQREASSGESAAPRMRVGWSKYRDLDDTELRQIRQLGVEDILLVPYQYEDFESAIPTGDEWSSEELVEVRDRIAAQDLRLVGFEQMPITLYDVLLDDEGRDESIEKIKTTIRNMGAAGIPVLGYSGHPPNGVGPTTRSKEIRGGAKTTAFVEAEMEDPGQLADRQFTEEELWEIYEAFLAEVLPVAEEAGVQLAVHPSDPPIEEIGGVPLLFRNFENFKRAMELVSSENHGLKLCLGCWSEMGEDVLEVIRYFGSRDEITYVHFRDVVGTVPEFYETFLDDEESNYNEYDVVQALYDVGYSGLLLPDHVPMLDGEDAWEFGGTVGRSFTVGYIRGLIKSVYERS